MELIRISADKLKISLTKAELDAYEMNVEDMDCGKTESKKAFRQIFVEAKEQTGFETDKENVFVQIFRAKNGGCEIFVSKIKKAKKESAPKYTIYKIESISDAINLSKELTLAGYNGKSSIYKGEQSFWIMLEKINDTISALVCEYGAKRDISTLYIDEHFKLIRKNDAVNILSKL